MKVLMRGFSLDDAKKVAEKLKYKGELKEFVMGLNVELEHLDVTKGDLLLTGKIVLAHLRESSKYYSVGVRKGFFTKKEVGLSNE